MGATDPLDKEETFPGVGHKGKLHSALFLNIGLTGCRVVYWLFAVRAVAGDVTVSRRVQSRMQESRAERDKNNELLCLFNCRCQDKTWRETRLQLVSVPG